jgi:hypothetical protein
MNNVPEETAKMQTTFRRNTELLGPRTDTWFPKPYTELTRGFQSLTQNPSYSNNESRKLFAIMSLLQEDRDALRPAGFSTLESQHRVT